MTTCQSCEQPEDQCRCRRCIVCTRTKLAAHELQTCIRCIGNTRADLTAIIDLAELLSDHALNGGGDQKLIAAAPIPGGDALVMLGPGSKASKQMRMILAGLPAEHAWDEQPDDPVPPLMLLASAEDDWRVTFDHPPAGEMASVSSCARYLVAQLVWAAQHHEAFDEFAADLRAARARLEAVLRAGERDVVGVGCLDCEALLRSTYADPRPCEHAGSPCGCDQGGRRDEWVCSGCKRSYSEAEYRLAVSQAYDEHQPLRTGIEIQALLGIPNATLHTWVRRGKIQPRGKDGRGRIRYHLGEVRHAVMDGMLRNVQLG